jgi:transcriptional regulator with GAF, ATPase, and Fis domain
MGKTTRYVRIVDGVTGETVTDGIWSHDFNKGELVSADNSMWRVVLVTNLRSAKQLVTVELVERPERKPKPKPLWLPLKLRVLRQRHKKEELDLVLEALGAVDWSAREAAGLIGVSYSTMRNLIRKHGIRDEWRKRQ